jgi:hypothetical protein
MRTGTNLTVLSSSTNAARPPPRAYARRFNAKQTAEGTYDHLMDPATEGEVLLAFRGAPALKTPGHDGCGIDLLKLLVKRAPMQAGPASTDNAPPPHGACLRAFTILINHCIRFQTNPPALAKTWPRIFTLLYFTLWSEEHLAPNTISAAILYARQVLGDSCT